jgi:hypothetical protein
VKPSIQRKTAAQLQLKVESFPFLSLLKLVNYSAGSNSSFPAPHSGHTQSSGTSSNGVPGSTPLFWSPLTGS